MKKPKIRTGIEIECILNKTKHPNIKIGEYHNGIKLNKYWKAERDGSLNAYQSYFNYPLCVEFVSEVLNGKKGFNSGVESFIKKISKNYTINLKDVLEFNKSCGCHFHIGLSNNNKISNLIVYEIIEELRGMFFKKLNESNLREDLKLMVKNHYYRSYAKQINKEDYYNYRAERYSEFNKRSEQDNKGLEWRSFNLYGVETWEEFKTLLEIGYSCLEFLYKKRVGGYNLKKEAVRLPKKQFKEMIDFKNIPKELEINIKNIGDEVLNV